MKKITWYYIFTLGIGYLIARKKAKKMATEVNTKLTVTDQVPFEVSQILEAIGGKENYVENSATINAIKIKVKDTSKINKDLIKKMGAKGTMVGENNITCLFGDYSQKLSEKINDYFKTQK